MQNELINLILTILLFISPAVIFVLCRKNYKDKIEYVYSISEKNNLHYVTELHYNKYTNYTSNNYYLILCIYDNKEQCESYVANKIIEHFTKKEKYLWIRN